MTAKVSPDAPKRGTVPPDPSNRFRASRMVAPLALLAVGFALFTVVGSTLGDEDPNSEAAVQQSSGNAQGGNGDGGNGNKGKRKTPKRYEVKGGDTITAIAEKFGVDVDRIQRLNPDVDSQALTPGQKLKLRN